MFNRDLSNLKVLLLTANEMRSLPSFSNLSSLGYLDLNQNELTTIVSNAFNGLNRLSILNLASNDITAIWNRAFNDLTELQSVILRYNKLP